MTITPELLKLAEAMQEDCHEWIDLMKHNGATQSFEDLRAIWMYAKLADLQIKIKRLGNITYRQ